MSNPSTLDWEAFNSGPVNGMAVRISAARDLESKLNTALKRIKELESQLSGRDPIVDAELASLSAFVKRGCK